MEYDGCGGADEPDGPNSAATDTIPLPSVPVKGTLLADILEEPEAPAVQAFETSPEAGVKLAIRSIEALDPGLRDELTGDGITLKGTEREYKASSCTLQECVLKADGQYESGDGGVERVWDHEDGERAVDVGQDDIRRGCTTNAESVSGNMTIDARGRLKLWNCLDETSSRMSEDGDGGEGAW